MKDPRFRLSAVEAAELDELSDKAARTRAELAETMAAISARLRPLRAGDRRRNPAALAPRGRPAGRWLLAGAVAAGIAVVALRFGPRLLQSVLG
ncbi:MAG TPA: hypothetical protein VFQ44_02680 [Streptosporangiaceae bacterium]|nr:hypothetical protein [Streptosporangiaceae bacterium]